MGFFHEIYCTSDNVKPLEFNCMCLPKIWENTHSPTLIQQLIKSPIKFIKQYHRSTIHKFDVYDLLMDLVTQNELHNITFTFYTMGDTSLFDLLLHNMPMLGRIVQWLTYHNVLYIHTLDHLYLHIHVNVLCISQ